jgi:hypothetical protein
LDKVAWLDGGNSRLAAHAPAAHTRSVAQSVVALSTVDRALNGVGGGAV